MRLRRATSVGLICAALGYALLASSYSALITPLNRDEHQFLASAVLVARNGLQPYRDFAYFHVPNLVYVYAPLALASHPFFAARLFNGICAFALCAIVFCIIRRFTGMLTAAAATILFSNSDIFQFTAGKIWNHCSATLCALLAALALLRREHRGWVFPSGLALGMAIGIRLSFAPLIVPFLAAVVFGANRWRNILAFAAGGVLANLPTLYFCLTSWDNFVFGQLGYRKLVGRYLEQSSPAGESGLLAKFYELLQVCRADFATAFIFIIALAGFFFLATARRRANLTPEVSLVGGTIPFLFMGSLAPTPVHEQFWFQLLPFLLVLGAIAFARVESVAVSRLMCAMMLIAAAASFFHGGHLKGHVAGLNKLRQENRWTPHRVARAAAEITAALAPDKDGQILTLSPIFAIEGGLPFVKEFATGPFAWRVSHFVSMDEAAQRKMPWAPGMAEFLRNQPLRGAITGKDRPKHEDELVAALRQADYIATPLSDGLSVWRKPTQED